MKKLLFLFSVAILTFSLTSCGNDEKTESVSASLPETTAAPTETQPLKIEMIDVTNLSFQEAVKALNKQGFTDVQCDTEIDPETDPEKWIVTNQDISAGTLILPEQPICLTCQKLLQLDLLLHSDANLLFSKYDMEIFLNGKSLGVIPNGKESHFSMELLPDTYSLTAKDTQELSLQGTQEIELKDSCSITANLAHDSERIAFYDVNYSALETEPETTEPPTETQTETPTEIQKETSAETQKATPETEPETTPESVFDFALVGCNGSGSYYLFDEDEGHFWAITITDKGASEGSYTGTFDSAMVLTYEDDGLEGLQDTFKKHGNQFTLIDVNGLDWEYKEVPVPEAEKIFNQVNP